MKISIFVGCINHNTPQCGDAKPENVNSRIKSASLPTIQNNGLELNSSARNHYHASSSSFVHQPCVDRTQQTAVSKYNYAYNKISILKPHGTIPYVKLEKKNETGVTKEVFTPRLKTQNPTTPFKPGFLQLKQNTISCSNDVTNLVGQTTTHNHVNSFTNNYCEHGNSLTCYRNVIPSIVNHNHTDISYEQNNASMMKYVSIPGELSKPTIRIFINAKNTQSYCVENHNNYYNESTFFWLNNHILKYGWNFIQMSQELNCFVYDECSVSKNIVENLLTTSIDYLPYANWNNTFFVFNSNEFQDINIDSNIGILNRKFRCLNLNQILPIECHFQDNIYEPVIEFKHFFSNFSFIQSNIQGSLIDRNQNNVFKNVTFSFQTVPGLIEYTIYYNNDIESQLPFPIPMCNFFSSTIDGSESNKNCSKICKHCIIFVNNGTSYIENKNNLHYEFIICRKIKFICIQK